MRFNLILSILSISFGAHAFTLNGSFKEGWRGPTLKINFNLTNCPTNVLSAFKDAADIWNSVSSSSLEIKTGNVSSTTTPASLIGSSATDSPVIVCDNNFGTTTGADQNVVAGAGFSSVTSGTHLNYGGMILNTSGGTASINTMTKKAMSIIIAHELGHALGFGHSADSAALMYYNASYKKELRLSQDDWDAMTYLYPRDELSGDKLMGCGLVGAGSPPPGGMFWALLFLPILFLLALKGRMRYRASTL